MAADQPPRHDTSGRPTAFLPVSQVLEEEYVALHGALPHTPTGEDDARLKALYKAIHALPEKRAALCLSGGGIRSATFALGVLQGLARKGLLSRFDYLSTVSGGGYIGGWLSAWIHREGDDVKKVADALATLKPRATLAPEPPPVSYLREFSNYLSPRAGLLSTDAWTLLGTILRNMILIWVVLVPMLAAALMVPRFYLSMIRWANTPGELANPSLLLVVGGLLLAWAVAYIAATIPSSTTARRGQGKFLALCLLPLFVGLGSLTVYWAAISGRTFGHSPVAPPGFCAFVGFGVAVHLVAWAGYTAWLRSPWGQRKSGEGSLIWNAAAFVGELAVVVVAGAVGGAIAWLLASNLFGRVESVMVLYAALAPGLLIGAFLLAATVLVGLLSALTDDEDREWWARCGAWFLIAGTGSTVLGALVLFGPMLLSKTGISQAIAAIGGVSGLVTVVGGWTAKLASRDHASSQTTRSDRLMALLVPLAAVLFAAVLMIGLSTLTSGLLKGLIPKAGLSIGGPPQLGGLPPGPFEHASVLLSAPVPMVVGLALALALFGVAMARFINTNRFSLHAMYRNRLIRGYLGASNSTRDPNPFIGFDEHDNIQLHQLWPRSSGAATRPDRRKLLHVVNMALNLVHGERLAWQERKAHTFTASALHAGSAIVGYRRTRAGSGGRRDHYGGPNGMSLGTAITISGAAASPNMGYHSSPLVTFLMTLFNVRLGWWLGNPGSRGDRTFYLSSPRVAVRPIVAEAFGLTSSTDPYVYLSDGGHFENLGLYEMVLRRCHLIVVSDASCDEGAVFQDLGGAVRKIRADLGVPIDFDGQVGILPRAADPVKRAGSLYWALGRIGYSIADAPDDPTDPAVSDGWILYVKPAFRGSEPPDIYEYAMGHDHFPHEPTTDQFFSESQFESYRMLGSYVMEEMGRGWPGGSPTDFASFLWKRLHPAMPPQD